MWLEREQWIFLAALVFGEPNCDPGTFEVMLDAMKLQDLVIAVCITATLPSRKCVWKVA